MFEYIKDGINPRGAEYGATARAARAGQQSADSTEDLLELELADATGDRQATAGRIVRRRVAQQRRRVWWHRLDLIASAIFVAIVIGYMIAPDSGAVRGGAPTMTQRDPDASRAPVRSASPDNSGDMIDSAFCVNHSADNDPQNCSK